MTGGSFIQPLNVPRSVQGAVLNLPLFSIHTLSLGYSKKPYAIKHHQWTPRTLFSALITFLSSSLFLSDWLLDSSACMFKKHLKAQTDQHGTLHFSHWNKAFPSGLAITENGSNVWPVALAQNLGVIDDSFLCLLLPFNQSPNLLFLSKN